MRRHYRRDVNPDTTPIRDAFAELRKHGYVARMNFSCCGGCASYEIGQSKKYQGKCVYYHRQAAERLRETGKCMLGWSGDAKLICKILEKHGVTVTEHPVFDDSHCIGIDLSGELEAEAREREVERIAWVNSAERAW